MNSKFKMYPLLATRQVFTWLLLCPPDQSASKWEKIAAFIGSFTLLTGVLSLVVGSLDYFRVNISINLDKSVYTLSQISGFSTVAYMMITALYLRHKINGIIDHLTSIYKKCEKKTNHLIISN